VEPSDDSPADGEVAPTGQEPVDVTAVDSVAALTDTEAGAEQDEISQEIEDASGGIEDAATAGTGNEASINETPQEMEASH